MTNSIWCLFSIENNYDQPDNNLEMWWSQKPSLEQLFGVFNISTDSPPDRVVAVVDLWRHTSAAFMPDGPSNARYRLQEVKEGERLPSSDF